MQTQRRSSTRLRIELLPFESPKSKKTVQQFANPDGTTSYRRSTTGHCNRYWTDVKGRAVELTGDAATLCDAAEQTPRRGRQAKGGE